MLDRHNILRSQNGISLTLHKYVQERTGTTRTFARNVWPPWEGLAQNKALRVRRVTRVVSWLFESCCAHLSCPPQNAQSCHSSDTCRRRWMRTCGSWHSTNMPLHQGVAVNQHVFECGSSDVAGTERGASVDDRCAEHLHLILMRKLFFCAVPRTCPQSSIWTKMSAWTFVRLFCGLLSQQRYVVFYVKLSKVRSGLLFPSRDASLSRMLRIVILRLAPRDVRKTSSSPTLGVFALIPPIVALWCDGLLVVWCLLAEKFVQAVRWSDDGVNSLGNFRNERYRLGGAELPHSRPCSWKDLAETRSTTYDTYRTWPT